jgi:hypothetical protein
MQVDVQPVETPELFLEILAGKQSTENTDFSG